MKNKKLLDIKIRIKNNLLDITYTLQIQIVFMMLMK